MTDVYFRQIEPGRGGVPGEPGLKPVREPMFNAPWPALALVALIVGGYGVQSLFPIETVVLSLGFSPAWLADGRWWSLITALFLHGSWPHALMNGAFALAFGSPLARFLGTGARGAAAFFVFYLVCGALSSLGYAALHWGDLAPLVGASGAVSGLMGASSRLIAGRGRLGPILSRPVLSMGAAWLAVNVLIGVLGSALTPGADGAPIAWEAHLAGFLVGVLAATPFAWAAGRR